MARTFSATATQYLEHSNTGIDPSGTFPLAGAVWFYNDTAHDGTNRGIFSFHGSNTENLVLLADYAVVGNPLLVRRRGGGGAATSTNSSISFNTWQHAGWCQRAVNDFDSALNGNLVTSTTSIGGTGWTSHRLGRARRLSVDLGNPGHMAEHAIWNVALVQADWNMLSAGFSPLFVRPDGLLRYSPISQPAGVAEPDLVGDGQFNEVGTTFAQAPTAPPIRRPVGWQGRFRVPAGGGTIYTRSADDTLLLRDDRISEFYMRQLDGLLTSDTRTSILTLTSLDGLLLYDQAMVQAVRQRELIDTLLLRDDRLSIIELRAFDAVLLNDGAVRTLYKIMLDSLLLVDSVTASQSGAQIHTVTVEDALLLVDQVIRQMHLVTTDGAMLYDEVVKGAVRGIVTTDFVLLSDVVTRIVEKITLDSLLVVDHVTRVLLRVIADDPVFLRDAATANLIQAAAQALVWARVAVARVLPREAKIVRLLPKRAAIERNPLGLTAGILRPGAWH